MMMIPIRTQLIFARKTCLGLTIYSPQTELRVEHWGPPPSTLFGATRCVFYQHSVIPGAGGLPLWRQLL